MCITRKILDILRKKTYKSKDLNKCIKRRQKKEKIMIKDTQFTKIKKIIKL